MSHSIDVTGQRFYELVAIKDTGKKDQNRNKIWEFRCDCGKICEKVLSYVKCGDTKSCGCSRNTRISKNKIKDMMGQKFGRLLVIEKVGRVNSVDRNMLWKCKCDCGKIKNIRGSTLRAGTSKSCGCSVVESAKSRCGVKSPHYKHGRSNSWEYFERSETGYNKFIKDVKIRDQFCCQVCGFTDPTGRKLITHHIYAYMEYISLRTDMENGITLCRKCHTDVHRSCKKNVTLEGFEEWLLSLVFHPTKPIKLYSKDLQNKMTKIWEKHYWKLDS